MPLACSRLHLGPVLKHVELKAYSDNLFRFGIVGLLHEMCKKLLRERASQIRLVGEPDCVGNVVAFALPRKLVYSRHGMLLEPVPEVGHG